MTRAFASIAAVYRDAFSGLSREVWILSVALFINRAGTMVLPFLTLYLTNERGMAVKTAGLVVSAYGVGSILGSFLGGWLSDRLDPNRVQFASLLGAGVGYLALPHVDGALGFGIAALLLGLIGDVFRPALFVSVTRYTPPARRARAFALVRLAVNLGMTIGPAIGGILAKRHYEWLFLGDGATCIAASVFLFAALGVAPRARDQAEEDSAHARPSRVWRDLPFVGFLALVLLLALAFFQIFSTLPLYYEELYGFRPDTIGYLLLINGLIVVLLEMIVVRRLETFDTLKVAALGSVLVCAGLGVLPLGAGFGLAVASTVLWTFGEMLSLPMTNSLVAAHASGSNTGAYMGAYSATFSFGLVLAPLWGTWVYERFSPHAVWWTVAAFGAVLAVGFRLLAPRFARDEQVERT